MSPYREDGAREPDGGLTPEEREARDRRAARRRLVAIGIGVPLTLVSIAVILGALIDRFAPPAPLASSSSSSSSSQTAGPPDALVPLDGDPDDAPVRARIAGTVEESCYDGCPTYAEAWANVREGREPDKWCVVGDRSGTCTQVETGTCGRLRYVKIAIDPICGGGTRYFDDTGTLIGVVSFSPSHELAPDGAIHDPIRERIYGHVPDCELVASDRACVKPAR